MKNIIIVIFLMPIIILAQDVKLKKKYDHPDYTIEYPENWILDESGKEGAAFVVYPKLETEKDFVENINLVKQNLKGNQLTIKKLKSITESQITRMLNDSKTIVSEIVDKNGVTYHSMVVSGETSGMSFVTKIYSFIVNDNLYILTLVSKTVDYENIKAVSNKIMNSFCLK